MSYEPLSVLAADDPVTCAKYTKKNGLLSTDGCKRFRNLAKKDKILARAVMQSKIRQFTKSYKEALEFDKENDNTKWADTTRDETDCLKEQEVFTTCQRVKWDSNHK